MEHAGACPMVQRPHVPLDGGGRYLVHLRFPEIAGRSASLAGRPAIGIEKGVKNPALRCTKISCEQR